MNKKDIYEILTHKEMSIKEKYQKIIEIFPHYLENTKEKKDIYEKIEWIFHDGLWTYFELLVFDEIIDFYGLKIEKTDKKSTLEKLENAQKLYEIFFENNEYNLDYKKEVENIKLGAKESISFIKNNIWEEKIAKITHSAWDFIHWNARDIFITLESWKELNFSLKTDKSWKVAISDWQTPKIFEKVYKRYFNLLEEDYEKLKIELFQTNEEKSIFEDFQNVALLTQTVIIKQFSLKNVEINNFKNAKITNLENLKYFINQLKYFKNWKDNAIVLLVNRLSWNLGFESIVDNIWEIKLEDFSFTPTNAKKYKYATEPWIKYKWKTFISFQIKHKRGKNVSNKFQDITIRLRQK